MTTSQIDNLVEALNGIRPGEAINTFAVAFASEAKAHTVRQDDSGLHCDCNGGAQCQHVGAVAEIITRYGRAA